MYKTTVQLILRSQYLLQVLISLPITRVHYISSPQWQTKLPPICSSKIHMVTHPQLPVTNTTSSFMLTQVSHVDPQLLWESQRLPVCSPKCHMWIPSSLWQTQIQHVCSSKCDILQPLVTNTTSSCMLIQVSHVDPQFPMISTNSACMLTQVSHVDSQLRVTNTTSVFMLTQVSHVDLHIALVFVLLLSVI